MKIVLDTNCLIDAVSPTAHAHRPLQKILQAFTSEQVELLVSRHSLAEISRPEPAVELARKLCVLPHWPIGSWDEQISTWDEASGTWDDARRHEQVQQELKKLAKSGNDIRDRGAYLDALMAGADVFVTSDKQLVGSRPAERLNKKCGLRVVTPATLVAELGL